MVYLIGLILIFLSAVCVFLCSLNISQRMKNIVFMVSPITVVINGLFWISFAFGYLVYKLSSWISYLLFLWADLHHIVRPHGGE